MKEARRFTIGADSGFGSAFSATLVVLLGVLVLLVLILKRSGGEPVIPLVLTPEDDGFVVSSPLLPALNTQGESREESIENARDAFASVKAMYAQLGRDLPPALQNADPATVRFKVAPGQIASPAA